MKIKGKIHFSLRNKNNNNAHEPTCIRVKLLNLPEMIGRLIKINEHLISWYIVQVRVERISFVGGT